MPKVPSQESPDSAELHLPVVEAESAAEDALSTCRKLRTKMAFLPVRDADGDAVYWQKGDSSTAVYWCLRTMECAGPDGGLAHASLCRGDRVCCELLTS
jgi:hypothetical protein